MQFVFLVKHNDKTLLLGPDVTVPGSDKEHRIGSNGYEYEVVPVDDTEAVGSELLQLRLGFRRQFNAQDYAPEELEDILMGLDHLAHTATIATVKPFSVTMLDMPRTSEDAEIETAKLRVLNKRVDLNDHDCAGWWQRIDQVLSKDEYGNVVSQMSCTAILFVDKIKELLPNEDFSTPDLLNKFFVESGRVLMDVHTLDVVDNPELNDTLADTSNLFINMIIYGAEQFEEVDEESTEA